MATTDGTDAELFLALGSAVSKLWSDLPQEIQQRLFEEVIAFRGESTRAPLALFLHQTPRTTDALKAQAIQEPDSLGG
jgi:hypothetical protein